MTDQAQLDQLCINTIRTLSIDAVQKAQSGHPGTPIAAGANGLLAVAAVSALRSGRTQPAKPRPLRALGRPSLGAPYSLLYLCGVKAMKPSYKEPGRLAVALDDIKRSRNAGWRPPTTVRATISSITTCTLCAAMVS
ncbi:MAG: hypothetical protein ABI882_17030 [Acidobacteriota bacterium]